MVHEMINEVQRIILKKKYSSNDEKYDSEKNRASNRKKVGKS